MAELTMDKLVALCKNRGFIFAGSEIYGGLSNTWDYGPLGVEYKNNIKKAWWRKFVQESPYNTGLDCAILMNREVWVASGHVGGFNDPLMDCKACKARFRADKLIEDFTKGAETGDGWTHAGGALQLLPTQKCDPASDPLFRRLTALREYALRKE